MEVDIIRTEVFVVDHSDQDEYGNLNVVSKEGKAYRINKKHEPIHSMFTDEMAVEVGYGYFMNKEFIHTARQVKDAIGPTAQETLAKPEPAPTPRSEPAPQAVGMTTKELGDMIRAGKLVEVFGSEVGSGLVVWYRGQILGTTRIEFDGAKLPKFK